MTTLSGVLERITFHNEANQYTIGRLRTDESKNLITIVGCLAGVGAGERLVVGGKWETHARYGPQFKVETYEVVLPADREGVETYLRSGMIQGIGRKMADKLLSHFQEETLIVIEKHPEKLLEINGIGKKTAEKIVCAWKSHHDFREVTDFLGELNVRNPAFYGSKILKHYGSDAISAIRHSPYQLVRDIPEIDFYTADLMAGNLGFDPCGGERIRACIEDQLNRFALDGHMFIPRSFLLPHLENRFGIFADAASDELLELEKTGVVALEEDFTHPDEIDVYPIALYEAETGMVRRLKAYLSIPVPPAGMDRDEMIHELVNKIAIQPSAEQLDVIEGVLSHRVSLITGGPGTGKTTLIRSIAVLLNAMGKKILLAAPTGRAARRLSEVTQRRTETIHKLLGYNLATGTFDKDQDDPLEADAVIIDEASMIDTLLMFHLLNAVPMSASLILVGDIFQLPSIGPGNVLSDMIDSNTIKAYELTQIFRQDRESPIVCAAHRVRRGEMPELSPFSSSEDFSPFSFIEEESPDGAANVIVKLCTQYLPERFFLNPVNDIQVITPMHKGTVGTLSLNRILQKKLNPPPKDKRSGAGRFRIHDKVMHLKNNYQKEVFNGDIGIILDIEGDTGRVHVNYDDRLVSYEPEELDELTLAYAISVHKSQGSEYPVVIIPLLTQHFIMLQRNLLYTAITRGKQMTLIVGTRKALAVALKNDKPRKRLSALGERLKA